MKHHESVRIGARHWRLAGVVAGVAAGALPAGCSEGGAGGDESSVAQVGALTAPPSNDWPQFQHDAIHSGDNLGETAFTSAKLHKPLQTAFKAHYGSSGDESGAVEAGGVLYVGDSGSDPDFAGKVSAFNAAGCGVALGGSCEPLWQGITGGGITTTPAIANGFVIVASRAPTTDNSPFLFGFAAAGCGQATCQPVWRGALANAVVDSSPAVVNGIAYVGDFGGRMYAFDVVACGARHNLKCAPLWTGQAGAEEELTTAPVVGQHFVFVSSFLVDPNVFTGRLNAFKIGGCGKPAGVPCAPAWTADIGGPGVGQTVAGSTVFVSSGTLFGDGPTSNFHLQAYSEAGCGRGVCTPIRVYDTGDVGNFGGALSAPVVVGNTLLVSSQNTSQIDTTSGVVSAYAANGAGCVRNQCEPIWIGASSPPTNGSATPPAVAGDVVFVGRYPATGFQIVGNDAGVFAYKLGGCGAAQTLCPPLSLTQVGLNQFNLNAPLAIARGAVYYTSTDNDDGRSNVYALKLP
jgi:hypothetical protein